MTKRYVEEGYCPFCERGTKQDVTDAEHERDSSNDARECLECRAHWMGLTGKWTKYVKGKYEERQ